MLVWKHPLPVLRNERLVTSKLCRDGTEALCKRRDERTKNVCAVWFTSLTKTFTARTEPTSERKQRKAAYTAKGMAVKWKRGLVMSSCLCKYGEGAGFPFQVESLEDGVDDAVHAFDVHKAHHRPGAPSYFHEAAFDHIGGP